MPIVKSSLSEPQASSPDSTLTLDIPRPDLTDAIAGLLRHAPKCVFAGDIGAAGGLADLIAFTHQNRWSGALRIMLDGTFREIRFRHGEVRSAYSNRPQDRLGELLFRYGRISRAQLDRALAYSKDRRIGQALIELRMIGTHDLFMFIKKQVEEIFFSLLGMRSGHYCFERVDAYESADALPDLGLSTRQLLFDGARLMDEMQYFKERIPSGQAVPVNRPAASNLVPLSEEARLVLTLVDGERTVEEIGRESKLGEIEATRVLFQLMQAGRIELKRELAGVMGDQYGGPRRLVEFLNNFLRTVQATLEACGNPGLLRDELSTFFGSTTKFADLFRDLEIDETVGISADQVIINLTHVNAADQVQYLQRGLHELLCFLLFVVGDNVGLQRQQELSLFLIDANRTLERDNRLSARTAKGNTGDLESRVKVVVDGEEKLAVLAPGGGLEAELASRDLESA